MNSIYLTQRWRHQRRPNERLFIEVLVPIFLFEKIDTHFLDVFRHLVESHVLSEFTQLQNNSFAFSLNLI